MDCRLAKLCVLHNLANFPIFCRRPRILVWLGLGLSLKLYSATKVRTAFVFCCAAVHTQFHALLPSSNSVRGQPAVTDRLSILRSSGIPPFSPANSSRRDREEEVRRMINGIGLGPREHGIQGKWEVLQAA